MGIKKKKVKIDLRLRGRRVDGVDGQSKGRSRHLRLLIGAVGPASRDEPMPLFIFPVDNRNLLKDKRVWVCILNPLNWYTGVLLFIVTGPY